MIRKVTASRLVTVVLVLFTATARAENEGQKDLDRATQLQLKAQSLGDVEKVIGLCESALEKGLDEDNRAFAKKLLVSALWQHATRLSSAILEQARPSPRWQGIRGFVLRDLEKLLTHDDKFADAYVLRAKLQALPGGDPQQAMQAIDTAIQLYKEDNKNRSIALTVRARLQAEPEKQLADLTEAVQADPGNAEAWQLRAAYYIGRGDLENAVKDFQKLLEQDAGNIAVHQALAEALSNLEKYDLALEHVRKAMELAPESSINYTLRAAILQQQGDTKAALADLDQALKMEPRDGIALMMRARLHFLQDELELARADVDRLLQFRPGARQAILLRSMISASQGKMHEAITDIQDLLRDDPQNVELRLQLGALYVSDQRPRKAIGIFTAILEEDKDDWMALRARGDALLSVGKHAEAIQDYNTALKLQPENDGILNNLAWVLATSPVDELRDGKRSIELATKACEVTKYEKPHILSTLAAGYAETGDFETAIKWSTKAVELGRESLKEQLEQLQQELESYKNGKPFREMQNVEERPDPPKKLIET